MPELSFNYSHVWDKMTKGIDQNGPYYKVSYYFSDWADSDAVANELMGYTQRVGESTIRVPPHTHPLSPSLYCSDVEIEPCGVPTLNVLGRPSFTGGFIAHAEYRQVTYVPQGEQDPGNKHQIDPDNPILWCTQELDFDNEVYVYEGAKYTWSTADTLDGKPTDVPVKVTLGVTTMTLTFHQLPYLPMAAVRSLRNKVNSATFLGVAAGKLLFVGGKTSRELNSNGEISQRVVLVFKERDEDWRYFLRRDIIQWDFIKDSGNNYVFESASFAPLALL